jgi:hypothetical protein
MTLTPRARLARAAAQLATARAAPARVHDRRREPEAVAGAVEFDVVGLHEGVPEDDTWPRATQSFYTVVDCHWLSFLRDLHSNLAFLAVSFSQNDNLYVDKSVALG